MRFHPLCWLAFAMIDAAVVLLSPDSPGGFREAVSNADVGDVIQLQRGHYLSRHCGVVIDKSLTIIGIDGADATVVDCEGGGECMFVFFPQS